MIGKPAIDEIYPGVPRHWPELLLGAPESVRDAFGPARVALILRDGDMFFQNWSARARQTGWQAIDLFGVHPVAPAARYDEMGLIPLLGGSTVRQLQADGAVLASRTGSRLTVQRQPKREAVLIWTIERHPPSESSLGLAS